MDFQLEIFSPQSNVIDLNKFLGMVLNHLFRVFSLSIDYLPISFNVIVTF